MVRTGFFALAIALGLVACDKSTSTVAPEGGGDEAQLASAEAAPVADEDAPGTDAQSVDSPAAEPTTEPAPASDYDPEAPVVNDPTAEPSASDAVKADQDAAGRAAEAAGEAAAAAGGTDASELPKATFKSVKKSCGKDGDWVGKKLKPFKLENTKGKAVGNRSFGRKVLLVNFWGTWCKPCLKELPEFNRLQRKYRKHGLTTVAIATDEEADAVQEIVDKKKLRMKVLLGGEDYAGKYSAPNFPFSFVVDPSGKIVGSYYNYKPDCMGKLEADIRKQLEKRNSK